MTGAQQILANTSTPLLVSVIALQAIPVLTLAATLLIKTRNQKSKKGFRKEDYEMQRGAKSRHWKFIKSLKNREYGG